VPFGGLYRLIDFARSNLANGGILKMCVLTQYKNHGSDRHVSTTWRMCALLGNYVTPVPAQQRLGRTGTRALGRRDLPVDEPDQRREAGHRDRLRRRSRVPHGPESR